MSNSVHYSIFYPIFIRKDGEICIMGVFKSDGNYIYLDTQYIEFYIPMYYFDTSKRFAKDFNDKIDVLGVFNVGIFENNKLKGLKTFNLPTFVTLFVYDSEIKDIKMQNGETMQCKVLKYMKGAKIMQSTLFKDDTVSKDYLKYITAGNLPKGIPYSKSLQLWRKNQDLNGVNFGVSSLYLELILSVVYRNPNDLSQKFAKIASNDGVGDFDYATASIRQICQYNSTFTALTFEDMDSMITTSLNKSRNKVKENESPVEQVIKF